MYTKSREKPFYLLGLEFRFLLALECFGGMVDAKWRNI